MLQLPHGCHVGKISVTPANWLEEDASTTSEWIIYYYFHHPDYRDKYPKGYLKKIRGMNDIKDLKERRKVARALIKNEEQRLRDGYNPILDTIVPPNEFEIAPSTCFPLALDRAFKLIKVSPTQKKMTNALPHLKRAIQQLSYGTIPVSEIRQHHLEKVLMQVARNKEAVYKQEREQLLQSGNPKGLKLPPEEWGAEAFNSYRAYLQILFKMLKKVGATEVKPVDDIEKRKGPKEDAEPLDADDWNKLEQLKATHYTFWRMIRIFYRSGARTTEMMELKLEHVEISRRRFKLLIKKGRGGWQWVWKTIFKDVLPLWEQLLAEAQPGDYLFAKNLQPGSENISARQLTIRWRKHVKKGLGLTKDWYDLKRDHTTKVIDIAMARIDEATKVASDINSHKSTAMNKKHYDLRAGDRLHDELARLGN